MYVTIYNVLHRLWIKYENCSVLHKACSIRGLSVYEYRDQT